MRGRPHCWSDVPLMLTVDETARLLNISAVTIRRKCVSGSIKAAKICDSWRIDRDALLEQFGIDPHTRALRI